MEPKSIILSWFSLWESGDFQSLPLAEDFTHTSPIGIISSKKEYLELVEANREKFLGHQFELHDLLVESNRGCVRYTAIQDDFSLEVSEWHYIKDGLISELIAHYHIGEIREDRKLRNKETKE